MVVNATIGYQKAERKFLFAKTTEEKISTLKVMISLCPKHKGSEAMQAELRRRLAKLKEEQIREKEVRKRTGHAFSVKKEGDAQVCMIGLTKSGKSLLLSRLTNAKPPVSEIQFTTKKPEVGTLDIGAKIQVIELPSLKKNESDKEFLSIAAHSDLILVIVSSLKEIEIINKEIEKINNKKLIVVNKADILDEKELNELLRFQNSISVSALNYEGISELKEKIFAELNIIRIYTKEPRKEHTKEPLIIFKNATIKDAAEKIRRDFSSRFLFARVWGKSARFPGQRVGLSHRLEDRDVLELHIK